MNVEGYVYDIESDGFYLQATKIWVIWLKDLQNPDKKLEIKPFCDPDARKKFTDWHLSYSNPFVVAHYGLGFDQFMMMKHLGIGFTVGPDTILGNPCVFIDTLALSMFVDPDLNGHSIGTYGERFGLSKIDYRQRLIELGVMSRDSPDGHQFSFWHPEMGVYCERDVDVNYKVFWYLWKKFTELYNFSGSLPQHYRCFQKQWYLMTCQELSGWKFDIELGKKLSIQINEMMREIEVDVEPKLPPRKLKKAEEKEYTIPAKPFKKNGEVSTVMEKWMLKHSAVYENGKLLAYGKSYDVVGGSMLDVKLPMRMGNQDDMKDWFLSNGWIPTLWNYKRGPDGKPERDPKTRELIPTTPKIQEAGKICPNLEKMEGDIVKSVVKWLSLRNRLAVLEGWMSHPRLNLDGRLPPSRTGTTPTFRQKHSVIVNVPKASDKVLLGKEFRSLFIAEDGFVIAAGDASALEGRVEGHFTTPFDGGKRADIILNGDVHSNNAKLFYPQETLNFDPENEDFDKDDPLFKPYRDRSKNGAYALAYGCSPPKLAKTLGKPEDDAQKLYDAFWLGNPSLAALRDKLTLEWEKKNGKAYVTGIDGRKVRTRKKSALLNSLFQSTGAIAMDYAGCFMDKWLGGIKWDNKFLPYYNYKGYVVKRIGFYHDEYEFECPVEIAEEVGKMIELSIKKAGELLKLNVPLKGEAKIGLNWKETH